MATREGGIKEKSKRVTSQLDMFTVEIWKESSKRVQLVHHLAKKIWKDCGWTAEELQNRCLDAWDDLAVDLGSKIKPLVPVQEDRPVTNLIFGSGKFSTGEFQIQQYQEVAAYTNPPVISQGLVANRSEAHGCNAAKVSRKLEAPLVELDFADWYREFIDRGESRPIQATRFWFPSDSPNRPNISELSRRFDIRQNHFHKALGERIEEATSYPTDIASARGYSFQFCTVIFKHQKQKPHVNDTHPADLTYVDLKTKKRLYPGWQAGPVKQMVKDGHKTLRGSLFEVEYMDQMSQIDKLDEGALLAIGGGVTLKLGVSMKAQQIQNAIKLVDDYVFCTLEPTGLLLTWGVTEKPHPVTYQDIGGQPVIVKQHLIMVGDKIRSGVNAWGRNLKRDLKELENFLFPRAR